jgi:hypothetical protein
MKLTLRAKALSAGMTLGALVALGALLVGGTSTAAAGSAGAAKVKGCTESKNVEAILDDSGSMSASDPSKFRTTLLNTFANIGANSGRVFGGVEFGTTTNPLFGPGTIPGIIPAMQASFAQVDADNGGTDYQEAFAGGNAHNGAADARIFLTDGLASKPTSHLTPPIKTYVIALGADFAFDPDTQALLSQIAAETGGPPPFLVSDPSQIQPVAGAITAALDCKKIQTFVDQLNAQGDSAKHKSKADGKTMDVLTSWGTFGSGTNLGVNVSAGPPPGARAGSALASAAAKKGKVKIKKTSGPGFVSIRVKGLKKGQKIKIKIKAKSLIVPTVATTQVIK